MQNVVRCLARRMPKTRNVLINFETPKCRAVQIVAGQGKWRGRVLGDGRLAGSGVERVAGLIQHGFLPPGCGEAVRWRWPQKMPSRDSTHYDPKHSSQFKFNQTS